MSRTKRGGKGPGFDYWSKRANGEGKNLQSPGRFSKKSMNRATRHRDKQKIQNMPTEG